MKTYWAVSSVLSTLLIVISGAAQANGTETLGPPNIVIAPGTNLSIEGTGLLRNQARSTSRSRLERPSSRCCCIGRAT